MAKNVARKVENLVQTMAQRIREGEPDAMPNTAVEISSLCGDSISALMQVLNLAGRQIAEKQTLQQAFEAKKAHLESLMASPRRISLVLGLLRDVDDEGHPQTWAIVEGPPLQACRIAAGTAPEDICEDHPDDPVWVWLLEGSPGDYVVAGRINPPPLLETSSGPEEEMVFEGFDDEEGER